MATTQTMKTIRLMRVSAEIAALTSFFNTLNGHAEAAPPTPREERARKLVAEAHVILFEQLERDRKGVLPGD